jgi:hypothetical protein
VELAEVLLGAAAAIDDGGVDFVVAVILEDVQDGGAFFEGMDAGLFGA